MVTDARRVLKPGGWLLAGIGLGTRESVAAVVDRSQLKRPALLPGLAAMHRVVETRAQAWTRATYVFSSDARQRPTVARFG